MTSILDALFQVESSGIPGRRGPKTPYGQPLGIGQTLPGTAREMAQKLGLPWRPDLLTSPTEEGAQYQKAVSQAYLNEGMERTGNQRDALRYYHGGPNRQLWGPKTNAYADKVMGLAGGEQMPQYGSPQMPQTLPGQPGIPGYSQDQLGEQLTPAAAPSSIVDILSGPMPSQMQVQKPKAFGKGGTGWAIAGIIADAIAKGFGSEPGFGPNYLKAQEDERATNQFNQRWQQKVAQDREDRLDAANIAVERQKALLDYKRANPDPPDPTTAARMLVERGFQPGTPEFQRELGRYMNRPVMINGQPFGYGEDAPSDGAGGGRSAVRTGVDSTGRRVIQYDDGTIDYAD